MCRNKRLACGCKEASRQDKNIVIFEFSQFTPAGQDFFFSATMQGRSLESLVSDMEEYYEGVLMQMRKPICGWTATDTAKTAHPTNEGCAGRHGSGRWHGQ